VVSDHHLLSELKSPVYFLTFTAIKIAQIFVYHLIKSSMQKCRAFNCYRNIRYSSCPFPIVVLANSRRPGRVKHV